MSNQSIPQLDFTTLSSQIFWLSMTYIFFYTIMKYIILHKVQNIVGKRKQLVSRLKNETEDITKQYEGIREKYTKSINRSYEKAQNIIEEITQELKTKFDSILQDLLNNFQMQINNMTNKINNIDKKKSTDYKSYIENASSILCKQINSIF